MARRPSREARRVDRSLKQELPPELVEAYRRAVEADPLFAEVLRLGRAIREQEDAERAGRAGREEDGGR